MSSFLYRLGRLCFRRRGLVVVIWLVALLAAGGGAVGLQGKFDDAFTLPGTQSQDALDQLQRTFPQMAGASATVVVVLPDGQTVDDPGVKKAIEEQVGRLNDHPEVESAQSPYGDLIDGLVSDDREAATIPVMMKKDMVEYSPEDKEEFAQQVDRLRDDLPGAEVQLGGQLYSADVPTVSITEVLGVIVALIVLCITFQSIIAATFPLVSAVMAVGVSLMGVVAATGFMTINSTTPMLALMLGLALGIDYALFILSRHRDQLEEGMDVEESVARATGTAGSAVVFAGVTNVIALIGLGVAGIPFLTVMGIAGAITVTAVIICSLTLVPALAGFAGERVRPRKARGKQVHETPRWRATAGREGGGAAGWWVRVVTRVPIVTVLIVVVSLGTLAIPFKDLRLALPDAGIAPPGSHGRVTYDLVAEHFGPGHNGPLIVTAGIVESEDPLGLMDDLKQDVEAMDGVALVALATPNETADTGILQVIPTTGPEDPRTTDLVNALRDRADEWHQKYGVDTAVTGFTAIGIDVSSRLGDALLPFGMFTVGLSLVLLTTVFRSIAIPIKTAVTFLLSVFGAFGATSLVFGHGWFKAVINLHDTGPVISFLPIITMAVLFGLAMDYEVFLVSRMREDYVRTGDARASVLTGFIASSKVVVAAACIMFAVFAFFVPEGARGTLKPIAFALAIGVAIDAFVVRMTLVPALLVLLGDKAWYLPTWLDRKLPHFDVEGDALHHQLGLANWPENGDQWSVYAEGLGVGEGDQTLFTHVDLQLRPGDVLVVEGEPRNRTALLLALAGRMTTDHGEARVLGHLVPEENAGIRRDTTFVDAVRHRHVAAAISGSDSRLLVVDRADALANNRDCATLVEAIRNAPEAGRTIILGALSASQVAALCPHGYYSLTLPTADDTAAEVSR